MRIALMVAATLFGCFVVANALVNGLSLSLPVVLFIVGAPVVVWRLAK